MFGEEDERWWTDERIELLMQARHEHKQPWPVVTKLLGARSELAVMRKFYRVFEQEHCRFDRLRIEADNLIRLLMERRRMLKPGEPLSVADPGFKLLKKITEMVKLP